MLTRVYYIMITVKFYYFFYILGKKGKTIGIYINKGLLSATVCVLWFMLISVQIQSNIATKIHLLVVTAVDVMFQVHFSILLG